MAERETWIVAVSGGVDSAVLLDMLVSSQQARLIVAHVDHGIREDSHEDAALTKRLAEKHGLEYEVTKLQLGPQVSELEARDKRYAWLDGLRERYEASVVVTAHHQDDVIETMILNVMRGTGWRGLCSLRDTEKRKRPLLGMSKLEVVTYALEHRLEWREDSTNEDLKYARNYIRHAIIPRLAFEQRQRFISLYNEQSRLRGAIEPELALLAREVGNDEEGLRRYWLTMLPEAVAYEVLKLAAQGQLLTTQLKQLLLFAKTARVGAMLEAGSGVEARATLTRLIVSVPQG